MALSQQTLSNGYLDNNNDSIKDPSNKSRSVSTLGVEGGGGSGDLDLDELAGTPAGAGAGAGARLTKSGGGSGGGGDADSTKARKKFGKRHSKNGLAAVF